MPNVRGGKQAARRLRGKQKPKQNAEKVKCCVPHCENDAFDTMKCGHGTCGPCIVGSLKGTCGGTIYTSCSQCRRQYDFDPDGPHSFPLKHLFAEFVPSHSKTLDACCSKTLVVAHLPCEHGCYGCIDSEIRTFNA